MMSDSSQRGKRGPAPSWKLGRTRAIRVPIVLADALLNLARRIDDGEEELVNAHLTLTQQVSRMIAAQNDAEKETNEGQVEKRDLSAVRLEAQVTYAKARSCFVEAQVRFVEVQNTFFDKINEKTEQSMGDESIE